MKRRVVITGMGCVTPAGGDVASTWQALLAGRSVVRHVPAAQDVAMPCTIGAPIDSFALPPLRQDPSRLGRATQFALAAAVEAVADAGLAGLATGLDRAGVIVGTGIGDAAEHFVQTRVCLERGFRAVHPLYAPKVMPNAAAAHVAIELGWRGTSFAPMSACAASAHAIALGLRLVQAGDLDLALVGGTDEMFSQLLQLAAFDALRALSRRNDDPEHASRPFDARRDGFVLGEGAGLLVIEEAEHARRRGARVHAELRGAGMTTDAYHVVAPEPTGDGAARAMSLALAEMGGAASDVQYVNAHGTATPLNDPIECLAIRRAFGAAANELCVGATKSVLGHMMGASAAVAAISTALTIREGIVPPIANYSVPDPACDLDFVAGARRRVPVRGALVNAFGFGGHCVSLAMGRFGEWA